MYNKRATTSMQKKKLIKNLSTELSHMVLKEWV